MNFIAGPTTQNVAHEAAMALAMLKYVPLGSGEEAGLTTDALQVCAEMLFVMAI